MSPTANSRGRSSAQATVQPIRGMTTYWSTTPSPMGAGRRRTRRKSSTSSVSPMPSMMSPSPTVIRPPLNQVKISGRQSARRLARRTQTGNANVPIRSAR